MSKQLPRLKFLMRQRNMTGVELAGVAGVSATTVYRACRGENISRFTMKEIARALGVSMRELTGGGLQPGELSEAQGRVANLLLNYHAPGPGRPMKHRRQTS